ncbi:mannose-1-phosphate guanylyltransferase/mannose-6-phosphate isomerase [Kordiimonas laminariae]|uniref:mannose-1-phosphate guanylyltransferase/mannose-6-phosphate isomerase n=1 Tax=Kordiimonas laminariae TaxID=2917717 RepID=UPI001FF30D03|nr:mannose-1-phosphate guanylyltransferase/mannose-6-phosphate isomerase [Kordiimonas laminariae]MCK0067966.1 mannose-1-phosphate guanylyltransferase/mannose-6-phosphate isomerase [Kordiimonas laminariae]
MKKTIYPVILSGGSGSRLWPMSRSKFPKQFLPMLGNKSLFVQALERVGTDYGFGMPLVVANEHHRFIVNEQADKAGIELQSVILEPVGRNTAPAIAVAALQAAKADPDALLLFLASDHVILDTPGFHKAVNAAACAAKKGYLVCFGMNPTRAETGYGYIQAGEAIEGAKGTCVIESFKEKPDASTAAAYLADGGYSWNSGMFMFAASTILEEFEKLQPEMLTACKMALESAKPDLNFLRMGEREFGGVPADSIDYAIMEKTDRAAVVPAEFGWSDVGSFSALAGVQDADADGNVTVGDVLTVDTKNTFVHGDGHLIATVGVENLVVVATDDAVMIANKDRDQDVKKVVEQLKAGKRAEVDFHSTVYRPWGNYRTLAMGDRYQVKEIEVYAGKRLSLQKHHHRAEHWVIVEGSAVVTRDEEEMLLTENQSVYLPVGAVHRLYNPGKIPLRLIEVQSGSYLGEDDIVRLEDDFNRENDK